MIDIEREDLFIHRYERSFRKRLRFLFTGWHSFTYVIYRHKLRRKK